MIEMKERIQCAAVWVDTGKADPPRRSFSYPKTGLMFCGWRHGDCFTNMFAWADLLPPDERERIGYHQGFMTSTGRFVNRAEAVPIAQNADQMYGRSSNDWKRTSPEFTCLTSEDIY